MSYENHQALTGLTLGKTTHYRDIYDASLLQGVPRGFDLKAIRAAMGSVEGVTGVHDLHLWSVAGDDASLTAHVAVIEGDQAEATRQAVVEMLEVRFGIHHATIQTESKPCGDAESLHA